MAVCTASVVTPAPPTAGRKVKICASVVSALGGGLATRAQVCTRSIGDTGLVRKSATRICIRRRATASSKFCVMATTGGRLPIRNTIRSSASSSASSPPSTSTTTTVALSSSTWSRSDSRPLMMSRPIWALAPNVARTDSSKPSSAVRTTTLAWTPGVMDRPMRMVTLVVASRSQLPSLRAGLGRRRRAAGGTAGRAARRRRRRSRRNRGHRIDRLGDFALAIALDRCLRFVAVAGDRGVARMRRPRIDHLFDGVGRKGVAGAKRDRCRGDRSRDRSSRRAIAERGADRCHDPAARRVATPLSSVPGRDIGHSILRQVEDVADIGPVQRADGEPRQRRTDFGLAHQEEVDVVRRAACCRAAYERSASAPTAARCAASPG